MKKLVWLFLFVILIPTFANARDGAWGGRMTGLYIGGGANRSWTTLEGANYKSRFDGWAPAVEAGFDLPFTDRFGLTLSGEYRLIDSTNTRTDNNLIEKASTNSTAGKVGFFLGPIAVGYGMSLDSMKVRQVSVVDGVSETTFSGQTQMYFASYNFNLRQSFRLALEGNYRTGDLGTRTLSDVGAMMKFYFLLESN